MFPERKEGETLTQELDLYKAIIAILNVNGNVTAITAFQDYTGADPAIPT